MSNTNFVKVADLKDVPEGTPKAVKVEGHSIALFQHQGSVYATDMRTIPGASMVYCPLVIAFDDAAGVRYRLTMRADNFPEVNLTQVTCISTDANAKCNQWKIEPSGTFIAPDGTLKKRNRAHFYKTVTSKGKSIETHLGDFYFSFQIQMTKQ